MTAPGGGSSLGNAIIRVSADVTRFARGVQMAVQRELSRLSWARFNAGAQRAGREAGRALSTSFGNALGAVGKGIGKMAPLLQNVAKYALIAGSALKTMAAAGPALGGLLTILGAIAATLPAIIVAGVLVSKTLTMAFKGVGDAMAAAAEGDAAKLEEAIKDLSPAAQAFVRDVAKISPEFKKLQKDVQESFFAPLKTAWSTAFNPGTLSALRTAMTGIADSFGRAAAGVAAVIGEAGRSGQLASIFSPLERAIERIVLLAPALTELFLGFADHAAPIVESAATAMSASLGAFFEKANAWVAEGGLAEFFKTAGEVAGFLARVLANLGSIFASLFSGLVGEGTNAVGVLDALLGEIAAFFKSETGQSLITTLGAGLQQLASIVQGVLLPLLPVAAKLLQAVFAPLVPLLFQIKYPLFELVEAFSGMLGPVIEELSPVFAQIGVTLGQVLIPLIALLTEHFKKMAPIAADMAKIIGPVLVFFFQVLGDALVEILPIIGNFAKVLQHSGDAFRLLAGVLSAGLLILTGAVFVIGKLGAALAWLQRAVGAFLLDNGWDLLIDAFLLFPRAVIAAVEWIVKGWSWAIDVTKSAWNAITGTVSEGVEKVTGFIGSLPGRVSAFAGRMFDAATSLGAAIGRGLSNIGNFASDIGGKIVGTIKSGINKVIGSINSGIAQIDSFLPGSLPRLSFFERGGIVDEPTLAMMGEKGKREVVLPLTNKARTLQLAQESGLLDMLRASGAMGGSGVPNVFVTAVLDGFGVMRVVDQRVEVKMDEQGRELAFGSRGV